MNLHLKKRFIGNRALLEDVRMTKRGSRPCVELVMNDGSRRGKIFGNLKETFRIATLLKVNTLLQMFGDQTGIPNMNGLETYFYKFKIKHV